MTEDKLADFLNKLNDLASDYGLVVGGYQQEEGMLQLLMVKALGEEWGIMEGLTMVQARELQRVARELWMVLDQDQYNDIMQIFKDAVDREIDHQREAGEEV